MSAAEKAREAMDGARRWHAKTSRLPTVSFAEAAPRLESRHLIKGLLDASGASVVYGESGSGKTFFALSLGLHIALGWDFFGRRVQRCGVVYVAAEAGYGLVNRVAAFKQHHGITDDAPFTIIPCGVDLCGSVADTGEIIKAIEDASARFNVPVGLVEIDTLSRALSGGDENAPADMGSYVTNLDRIRDATKAHTLSVHHSGKDSAKGARGHSLLRAAVDTEIEVTKGDVGRIATVRKQRELATDGEIHFKLASVTLGTDSDGDVVTSCVAIENDERPAGAGKARRRTLTPAQKIALDALKEALSKGGAPAPASEQIPTSAVCITFDVWRSFAYDRGISGSDQPDARKKAFQRATEGLIAEKLVGMWLKWCWLS